ncbi:triose-phosphate isomerase [Polaribacter reichenbachii]|uniref:Triosephosphate isomerase n=1 Tax=Polaribacter reichenbachii TaxID=996801 RepID=A0A1B8U7A7_9FLAO|nr:triose-phosphate isomerase [Polaribacter reichenbachii]APZ46469.1 triose-phosphate isomerase [Polaribacter reichenbachii]AUC20334.1 triose-phosphate isomerase [Polaribacter reichenbachii]OBY67764.1 triose-phosphate isomerase [Polaribacter reichenbachii]
MRQKIVAGNWKMNNDKNQTEVLISGIKEEIKDLSLDNTRVIISPSFINLESAVKSTEGSSIEVVAQNMHQAKSGAYTGEVSADMLKSIGIKTVILGHSERRTYFGETDEILAEKVNAVLENDLETIFCFGELLEDRKSDNHFNVVESQLKNALFHLEAKDWASIVLAYEPVWAIGTGETASAEQAQEMHAFIRSIVADKYNAEVAEAVSILYGGSVKPANAEEIFSKPDVDGGLIGGAALKASDFSAIIKAI